MFIPINNSLLGGVAALNCHTSSRHTDSHITPQLEHNSALATSFNNHDRLGMYVIAPKPTLLFPLFFLTPINNRASRTPRFPTAAFGMSPTFRIVLAKSSISNLGYQILSKMLCPVEKKPSAKYKLYPPSGAGLLEKMLPTKSCDKGMMSSITTIWDKYKP